MKLRDILPDFLKPDANVGHASGLKLEINFPPEGGKKIRWLMETLDTDELGVARRAFSHLYSCTQAAADGGKVIIRYADGTEEVIAEKIEDEA